MTAPDRAGDLVTLGETIGLVAAAEAGPLESARSFSYGIGGAESARHLGRPPAWRRPGWCWGWGWGWS